MYNSNIKYNQSDMTVTASSVSSLAIKALVGLVCLASSANGSCYQTGNYLQCYSWTSNYYYTANYYSYYYTSNYTYGEYSSDPKTQVYDSWYDYAYDTLYYTDAPSSYYYDTSSLYDYSYYGYYDSSYYGYGYYYYYYSKAPLTNGAKVGIIIGVIILIIVLLIQLTVFIMTRALRITHRQAYCIIFCCRCKTFRELEGHHHKNVQVIVQHQPMPVYGFGAQGIQQPMGYNPGMTQPQMQMQTMGQPQMQGYGQQQPVMVPQQQQHIQLQH